MPMVQVKCDKCIEICTEFDETVVTKRENKRYIVQFITIISVALATLFVSESLFVVTLSGTIAYILRNKHKIMTAAWCRAGYDIVLTNKKQPTCIVKTHEKPKEIICLDNRLYLIFDNPVYVYFDETFNYLKELVSRKYIVYKE